MSKVIKCVYMCVCENVIIDKQGGRKTKVYFNFNILSIDFCLIYLIEDHISFELLKEYTRDSNGIRLSFSEFDYELVVLGQLRESESQNKPI